MDWTAIIIAIIGSGVLTTLVNSAILHTEKKHEKKSLEREALRLLILGEIREYGKYLVGKSADNGGIEQMDYLHFEELYKVYKALDGDGFADKLHAEVSRLELL